MFGYVYRDVCDLDSLCLFQENEARVEIQLIGCASGYNTERLLARLVKSPAGSLLGPPPLLQDPPCSLGKERGLAQVEASEMLPQHSLWLTVLTGRCLSTQVTKFSISNTVPG